MTQPDSPDFEFDLANLELEGDAPSASKQGKTVSGESGDDAAGAAARGAQAAGLASTDEAQQGEDFDEGANFDIASLPDAFSEQEPVGNDSTITGEAERIGYSAEEPDRAERGLRPLGEDDLGADVFSELEDESSASFEDALDDLLEEVDTYEMGAELEGDEAASEEPGSGLGDYLNLDDPDDSVAATAGVRPYRPAQTDRQEALEVEAEAWEESGKGAVDEVPASESVTATTPPPESIKSPKLDFDEIPADSGAPDRAAATVEAPVPAPPPGSELEDPASPPELASDEGASVNTPPAKAEPAVEEGIDTQFSQSTSVEDATTSTDAEDVAAKSEESAAVEDLLEARPEESEAGEEKGETAPEEVAEGSAEQKEAASLPSAEDLLRTAGGLLNKDRPHALEESEDGMATMPSPDEIVAEAQSLHGQGESSDGDEEEEAITLPSPEDLVKSASAEAASPVKETEEELDEDLETLAAMPDPMSLIAEASAAAATSPALGKPSGNVADRPGDLPPPPPAPVEIIDDDPLGEDPLAPLAAQQSEAEAAIDAIQEEPGLTDPFAGDSSLEGFNEGLDDADAFEDALLGEETEEEIVALQAALQAKQAREKGSAPIAAPEARLTRMRRWSRSFALAAGLAVASLSWSGYVWKQEIVEYFADRDLDGSSLVSEIRKVGAHALDGFGDLSLYRLSWLDSEVRRVADNEIRLHATIGANLVENLYEAVPEAELQAKLGLDEDALFDALAYAGRYFPERVDAFPRKPWEALYRRVATTDETLPLRVSYQITRPAPDADWELSGIRVRGHNRDLEWPKGQPRAAFGENAFEVDSPEFRRAVAAYRERSSEFVADISALRASAEAEVAALASANREYRQRVLSSFGQGSFFTGMAIIGEDAAEAENVTMIITESREKGALVRGVIQADNQDTATKHFVGSVQFVEVERGREQGVLHVTTIGFDGQPAPDASTAFFDPGTVSRFKMKTDGVRLEGDMRDLSLRMTRHL